MHLEFEPPLSLRGTIKCFWYNNDSFDETGSDFEVVPDGYAEIIFYFGNLRISGDESLHPIPSPFMIGLLGHPVRFYTKGRLEIIAIRCYPWTVFELLGLPSGKGGIRTFEHPLAGLQPILDELVRVNKVEKAITQLSQYFLNSQLNAPTDIMLSKAGAAMGNANGTLPVSEVAAAAHATVRTLERKFRQSSGHTVKDVSGLMRFEQVRNRLWQEPDCNLAGLAHDLGYTDQSHLNREFKRYSGSTPAAFARKAKKGKKDMDDDFVTFTSS